MHEIEKILDRRGANAPPPPDSPPTLSDEYNTEITQSSLQIHFTTGTTIQSDTLTGIFYMCCIPHPVFQWFY